MPGDGWVSDRWELDRSSRLAWSLADDGGATAWQHDGLHRLATLVDAEDNRYDWHWDGGGLLLEATRSWQPRPRDIVLGRMPERTLSTSTVFLHDSLGRPVRAVDRLGDAVRWRWDSLDRLVAIHDGRYDSSPDTRIVDPLGQLASAEDTAGEPLLDARLSRPGNLTLIAWDAAGRRVGELRRMRVDGVATGEIEVGGVGNLDGHVVVDYAWDENGRLIAVADDGTLPDDDNDTPTVIEEAGDARGNVTRFVWDEQDRRSATVFDDGRSIVYEYDGAGAIRRMVDANGTVLTRTLDLLGRPVRVEVAPGADTGWAVSGTTRATHQWDGLDRLTAAVAESPGPEGAILRQRTFRAYDSLGRALEERGGDLVVSRHYSGRGAVLSLRHPARLSLRDRRDRIGRLEEREQEGAPAREPPIVLHAWLGPRTAETARPEESRRTLLRPELPPDDPEQRLTGLDPLGRLTAAVTMPPTGSALMAFTRTFGADGLPAARGAALDAARETTFRHDSLGRLVGLETSGALPRQWRLDSAGNRVRFDESDWQVDRRHAYNDVAGVTRLHDGNGNVVDDGRLRYRWDYADRLVAVERVADGSLLARYRYDALGRLVGRTVFDQVGVPRDFVHVYDGRRVIEDRLLDRLQVRRRYVYGRRVGAQGVAGGAELAAVDVVLDEDGLPDDRWFVHLDPRGDLVGLTARRVELDEDQREQVRLELIARTALDLWGTPLGEDLPGGLPRRFAGLPRDPETGLYRHEGRLYDPALGRWLQPAAAGGWHEPWALGNPYAFENHGAALSRPAPGRWPKVVVPAEPRAHVLAPADRRHAERAARLGGTIGEGAGPRVVEGALAAPLPPVNVPGNASRLLDLDAP